MTGSSFGSSNDTFFRGAGFEKDDRLGGDGKCDWCNLAFRSSEEHTEGVGEERQVSDVQARELMEPDGECGLDRDSKEKLARNLD